MLNRNAVYIICNALSLKQQPHKKLVQLRKVIQFIHKRLKERIIIFHQHFQCRHKSLFCPGITHNPFVHELAEP